MKEKKIDIRKATILLASTLGIVLNSCSDKEKEGTTTTTGEANKDNKKQDQFADINKTLKDKKINGVSVKRIEDVENIGKQLGLKNENAKDIVQVTNKIKELKTDSDKTKIDAIKEILTPKNEKKEDKEGPKTLQELLKAISEMQGLNKETQELAGKLLASPNLPTFGTNEKSEKSDNNQKDYFNKLKAVYDELNKKDDNKDAKDGDQKDDKKLKNILLELDKVLYPRCFSEKTELNFTNTLKKVYDSLNVTPNGSFEYCISEDKEYKISLGITFKCLKDPINLFSGNGKDLFKLEDDKTANDNYHENIIKDEDLGKTALYKVLDEYTQKILTFFEIDSEGLKVKNDNALVDDNGINKIALFTIKDTYDKVNSKISDIDKAKLNIKVTGLKTDTQLSKVYVELCKNAIDELEFDDENDGKIITENEAKAWVLKHFGITKDDSDQYFIFNNIKLDVLVANEIKNLKFNDTKKNIKNVWSELLAYDGKKLKSNNNYNKIDGKFNETVGKKFAFAFVQINNLNVKHDIDFKLDVKKIDYDYISLIMRILTGNFNDKILEALDPYKSFIKIDNNNMTKTLKTITTKVAEYLKLEKITVKDKNGCEFMAPYIKIDNKNIISDPKDLSPLFSSIFEIKDLASFVGVLQQLNGGKINDICTVNNLGLVAKDVKVFLISSNDYPATINPIDNSNKDQAIVAGKPLFDVLGMILNNQVATNDAGKINTEAFENIFTKQVKVMNVNSQAPAYLIIETDGSVSFSAS